MRLLKGASPALLISALNILNDAEINYKASRNKRLHVELALIKLCYLQQAIQLTTEGNVVSKKKLIEAAKPIAFRQITPFQIKETAINKPQSTVNNRKTEEAKLIIETPALEKISVAEDKPEFKQHQTSNLKPQTLDSSNPQPVTSGKLTLSGLRKQYQGNGNNGNGNINHPLELEELQKAWAEYIIKLKEAKNPAAQPFQLAVLRIKDENSFEAVTANNIEQKFIEQDRNKLFAFLQERLQNRLLQFNVIIEEKAEDRPVIEIPLNSKEQFQKIVEQYPLVKELKDKLRLELDY